MTWDVPTAEDCPVCGQTMFKKSGKGRMKPFCINENCENFLPEDKRGYYKKKQPAEQEETGEVLPEGGMPVTKAEEEKSEKKAAAKKPAAKKTAAKKTAAKKPAAKKKTPKKAAKSADSKEN